MGWNLTLSSSERLDRTQHFPYGALRRSSINHASYLKLWAEEIHAVPIPIQRTCINSVECRPQCEQTNIRITEHLLMTESYSDIGANIISCRRDIGKRFISRCVGNKRPRLYKNKGARKRASKMREFIAILMRKNFSSKYFNWNGSKNFQVNS